MPIDSCRESVRRRRRRGGPACATPLVVGSSSLRDPSLRRRALASRAAARLHRHTDSPPRPTMDAHKTRTAAALLIILELARSIGAQELSCSRDGLYADYESECRHYYRCGGGSVTGRYSCSPDRAFSEPDAACVPRGRRPCARRACAAGDSDAYATPGTACRHYYRCDNGTAVDRACPSGAWFDAERQACSRGAGTCFEPLCAGLPDGTYPDASHDCRRRLECRAGELRAVASCGGACSARCPAPRSVAVPLPAGDADFCSDSACASLCAAAADGAYADRTAGCREFFVCEARRVTRRGVCEAGRVFSGGACVPAEAAECAAPARSPCFGRGPGAHRDWRDCASWFECARERVVSRGRCAAGRVWDGAGCVSAAQFHCAGPERSAECEGRPSGMYQDLASNCSRYFHCGGGGLRTELACPGGAVWDGARCVPAAEHECPSLAAETCWGRADGRYAAAGSCRGYYACAAGERAVYACAPGEMFSGDECVPAPRGACSGEERSCAGRPDGYHADLESDCRRYFYCERGDRLATLSCLGGKQFDGRACVPAPAGAAGACGAAAAAAPAGCARDGFYRQPGTDCSTYHFCVGGVKTTLTCPADQAFNGQVCVSRATYSCPG